MNLSRIIVLGLLVALVAGCTREREPRFATGDDPATTTTTTPPPPVEVTIPPLKPVPPPPAAVASGVVVVGKSVEGRPINAITLGEGPRTILYLATIHGNESAGTPLVNRLIQVLHGDREKLSGWRVVVIPVVNPDGLASGSRHNSRNVDLNRNFPADNREERVRFGNGALSEPESKALHDLILRERPDRIVTLHQPLECVDYDGPGAQPIAERMAAVCDLPAEKLGARPGSLGAWAGETRGIPTITLELPREAGDASSDAEELWNRYGAALLAALE
jgi:protein MpaA